MSGSHEIHNTVLVLLNTSQWWVVEQSEADMAVTEASNKGFFHWAACARGEGADSRNGIFGIDVLVSHAAGIGSFGFLAR